jgi:hypothetical protein
MAWAPPCLVPAGRADTGGSSASLTVIRPLSLRPYEALRASSFSTRSLSNPTIQLLPILITGTPV